MSVVVKCGAFLHLIVIVYYSCINNYKASTLGDQNNALRFTTLALLTMGTSSATFALLLNALSRLAASGSSQSPVNSQKQDGPACVSEILFADSDTC